MLRKRTRTLVNRSLAKRLVGGTTATRGIKSIRFSRINSHNDSWNNTLSISWFLQRILSVNFLLNCIKPKIGSILSETGSKLTFEHFLFIAERVNILLVKITFVLKCEKKGNLFGKNSFRFQKYPRNIKLQLKSDNSQNTRAAVPTAWNEYSTEQCSNSIQKLKTLVVVRLYGWNDGWLRGVSGKCGISLSVWGTFCIWIGISLGSGNAFVSCRNLGR